MISETVDANAQGRDTNVHPQRDPLRGNERKRGWVDRLGLALSKKREHCEHVVLNRNNIYIFPSKTGLVFLLMLAIMLLTAVNYQNSLIYLFTFSLAAVFFVSIWLCFFELAGIEVSAGPSSDAEEGDLLSFNVRFHSTHDINLLECSLGNGAGELVHFESGEHFDLCLLGKEQKRGRYYAPALRIETRFPFGLVCAWTYVAISSVCYVYPRPVAGIPYRQGTGSRFDDQLSRASSPEDLRAYQQGDSMARMVWKQFASKDQLVIKEPPRQSARPALLHWEDYQGASVEERLRNLCHDVQSLNAQHLPFGLELPEQNIPVSAGAAHTKTCLRALASHGGGGKLSNG